MAAALYWPSRPRRHHRPPKGEPGAPLRIARRRARKICVGVSVAPRRCRQPPAFPQRVRGDTILTHGQNTESRPSIADLESQPSHPAVEARPSFWELLPGRPRPGARKYAPADRGLGCGKLFRSVRSVSFCQQLFGFAIGCEHPLLGSRELGGGPHAPVPPRAA
jgi:hypothetical protein